MAIRTKLSTKGFEAHLEDLVRAGQDVDAVAAEALLAGGAVLVDGMQRRAPKDTHNLESQISMTDPQQDGNLIFIEVGLIDVDADTARYGNAQEWGWADKTGAKAGRPYVRPTIDEDFGRARSAMRKVFQAKAVL